MNNPYRKIILEESNNLTLVDVSFVVNQETRQSENPSEIYLFLVLLIRDI